MTAFTVAIRRLTPDLPAPAYASAAAAGLDLQAAVSEPLLLTPGAFAVIPCGISIALPPGFEAQLRPRSGLAAQHGVTVLNAPGTIDADYRGEIKAILINHGPLPFTVLRGMRVAQLVIAKVERIQWQEADSLPDSRRGSDGFGSTGR